MCSQQLTNAGVVHIKVARGILWPRGAGRPPLAVGLGSCDQVSAGAAVRMMLSHCPGLTIDEPAACLR